MKFIKKISKNKIGQKFLGYFVYFITKTTFKSVNWKCLDLNTKNDIFSKNNSFIFCTWHNRLYCGPYFLPKHLTINALQSLHSDGMMTDVLFRLIKMKIIYGSSKKKGISAFLKMVKCIQDGESIAITPDGPKGPKGIIKDGLIKLAQTTGTPIVPIIWYTKKYQLLNSWDNFIIPFPFSKGVYIFGKPIYVERKMSNKKYLNTKKFIQLKLDELTTKVEKYDFTT